MSIELFSRSLEALVAQSFDYKYYTLHLYRTFIDLNLNLNLKQQITIANTTRIGLEMETVF